MEYSVDINCDVGEGICNETALMPYISSCNIACGAHAGNLEIINETIKLAMQHWVKIGAHPSFPDKKNFGRKVMLMTPTELQTSIEAQIIQVRDVLKKMGGKLHHVKPHGALYNLAAVDKKTALVVIKAIKNTANNVYLYVPYNSAIQKLALKNKLKIKVEAFADRNYNSNLTLVSRKKDNALIIEDNLVLTHLLKMIIEQKVTAVDGVEAEIKADTFCVHGDNPSAVKILKKITNIFSEKGIKIV
jgi:UPF0271 protein